MLRYGSFGWSPDALRRRGDDQRTNKWSRRGSVVTLDFAVALAFQVQVHGLKCSFSSGLWES